MGRWDTWAMKGMWKGWVGEGHRERGTEVQCMMWVQGLCITQWGCREAGKIWERGQKEQDGFWPINPTESTQSQLMTTHSWICTVPPTQLPSIRVNSPLPFHPSNTPSTRWQSDNGFSLTAHISISPRCPANPPCWATVKFKFPHRNFNLRFTNCDTSSLMVRLNLNQL